MFEVIMDFHYKSQDAPNGFVMMYSMGIEEWVAVGLMNKPHCFSDIDYLSDRIKRYEKYGRN